MRRISILAMFMAIGLISCGGGGGVANNTPLPNSIQDMQLQNIVTGDQAKQQIEELHQKPVTSGESYVGEYKGKNYTAKMYVTTYTGRDSALAALQQMSSMMMNPHDDAMSMGFQHVRKLSKYGDNVYMALKGNRAHYFYVEGKDLYWLDVDPHVAMAAMQQLVGTKASADSTGMM